MSRLKSKIFVLILVLLVVCSNLICYASNDRYYSAKEYVSDRIAASGKMGLFKSNYYIPQPKGNKNEWWKRLDGLPDEHYKLQLTIPDFDYFFSPAYAKYDLKDTKWNASKYASQRYDFFRQSCYAYGDYVSTINKLFTYCGESFYRFDYRFESAEKGYFKRYPTKNFGVPRDFPIGSDMATLQRINFGDTMTIATFVGRNINHIIDINDATLNEIVATFMRVESEALKQNKDIVSIAKSTSKYLPDPMFQTSIELDEDNKRYYGTWRQTYHFKGRKYANNSGGATYVGAISGKVFATYDYIYIFVTVANDWDHMNGHSYNSVHFGKEGIILPQRIVNLPIECVDEFSDVVPELEKIITTRVKLVKSLYKSKPDKLNEKMLKLREEFLQYKKWIERSRYYYEKFYEVFGG